MFVIIYFVDTNNFRVRLEHLLTVEVPSRYSGVPLPLQYFAQTMNLSRTGLGVRVARLPKVIRPGIDVHIALALPHHADGEGIAMLARVAWCQGHTFGLKIAQMGDESRALYEKLFPPIEAVRASIPASPPPFQGARYVPRILGAHSSEIDITLTGSRAPLPSGSLISTGFNREVILPPVRGEMKKRSE